MPFQRLPVHFILTDYKAEMKYCLIYIIICTVIGALRYYNSESKTLIKSEIPQVIRKQWLSDRKNSKDNKSARRKSNIGVAIAKTKWSESSRVQSVST